MIVPKVPKALILLLILALSAAVVVAGCGGGGSSSSEAPTEEAAPPAEENEEAPAEEAEEEPAEEESAQEERSGESSLIAEGKTVFTSTCGACHTLKAAGTSGEVGPNLDELEPDLATVEHQVVNGGGGMPAFGKEGLLNAKEIKAVATYVSTVAGNG
jgi:mono/diheme cytochrome c family protein